MMIILMREIFLWGQRGPFCSLKIPKKGPCACDCERKGIDILCDTHGAK